MQPWGHESWLKPHVYILRDEENYMFLFRLGGHWERDSKLGFIICLKSGWTFVSSQDLIWSQNLIEKTSISRFWIGGLTKTSHVQNNKHTTISEAKVGWFPTTLVIIWIYHTPPPKNKNMSPEKGPFQKENSLRNLPTNIFEFCGEYIQNQKGAPLSIGSPVDGSDMQPNHLWMYKTAKLQESFNTPLEHTPGNPPTQLWKDSLYNLLVKV